MTTPRLLCLSLSAALALVACITETIDDPGPQFVVSRTPDQVVWTSRRAQEQGIEAVVLEPLTLRSPAGLLSGRVTPEAITAAQQGFRDAMESQLGSAYPLVDEAGAKRLVVRAELTDRVSEPTLLPFVSELGAGPDGSLTRVALVVRFIDGGDGTLLASLVSVRESPRLGPMLLDGATPDEMEVEFVTLAARLRLALDRAWDWNAGS